MPSIAKSLDEADLQAVAAWFASLPPVSIPVDARLALQARADAARKPARTVVSGPVAPAAPRGIGTEEGGPVVGGSQGIGGTPPNTNGAAGRPQVPGGSGAGAASAAR